MKKYRAVEHFMQSDSLHRREMAAFKGSDTSVETRVNIQIPTNLKINHSLSEVTMTLSEEFQRKMQRGLLVS